MAYLTENQLRDYASRLRYDQVALANAKSSAPLAQATIFLSHSSKDRVLAQGFVLYLASLGISVYVNWNDSDMPRVTNRETAEKLKVKIKDNKLFMILATKNALGSKWVPWEAGIADQCKGERAILLVPVADPSGRYEGSEYLQLYRHVEAAAAGGFGVFSPGQTNGVLLESHVRAFAAIL
jgi:hypothetical protein